MSVQIYEQQGIDNALILSQLRLVIEKHCRGCGKMIDLEEELCKACKIKSTT